MHPRSFCFRIRRLPAAGRLGVVGLLLATAGCGWLGQADDPPLPGERIAVIFQETDLDPDPALVDLEVRLPPPYRNRDWPQSGGYPDHAMHHLEVPAELATAWTQSIGAGADSSRRILGAPVVGDGVIYTLDARYEIRAFDADTGRRLWARRLDVPSGDRDAFGGGLAMADGRLFVSTGFARLYALDLESGDELWQATLSGPVRAAPTVAGSVAIVLTIDNQAAAFDVATGEERWTHFGFAETAGLLGSASPAADGAVAVLPYSSGEIFVLGLDTGQLIWSDSLTTVRRSDALSAIADIRGLPVIDRGVVYAISHSGRMVASDLQSGARIWDRRIGGVQKPWVAGEFLFVLTADGHLAALTRRGGRVRWLIQLPSWRNPESRSGAINWVGPVLAGDRLIIGNNQGELWSVSPYTGLGLGRIDLRSGLSVAPIVADGTLYVQTDDGRLHAMR